MSRKPRLGAANLRKLAPALIAVGVLAILTGMGAYLVYGEFGRLPRVLITAGLLLLIAYTWVVPEAVDGLFGRRNFRYGANSAVMVLSLIGILVLVNYLASRYPERWDLTATRQFSLSEPTLRVLAKLQEPVEVTAFYVAGDYRQQEARDRLHEYSTRTDKLRVTFVDPELKPGLARTYGIRDTGTIVFETSQKRQLATGNSESELTSALMKLISAEAKRVYFLVGHGERSPDDTQPSGYSTVRRALENSNYSVAALNLAIDGKVPDDAAVLVVASPTKPLLESEEKAIARYLDNKGKLLLLTDPELTSTVAGLVSRWGVAVVPGVVVDPQSSLQNDIASPVVTRYNWSPITKDLPMTVFPLAVGIRLPEQPAADVQVVPLMQTSEGSWAETDKRVASFDEGSDTRGPLILAAKIDGPVSSPGSPRMRAVVIGDSDFASNAAVDMLGNLDLFVNCINWLAEEEDMIAISPKPPEARTVVLTAVQSNFVMYSSALFLPLAVAITGVLVWWRRR